jgi:hypothetical protein
LSSIAKGDLGQPKASAVSAKILPAAELIVRFKKEYDEAVDPPL